mmetsp:Transcript_19015/g.34470  ORF Transcript_19015/g.34470 Transcript_19015/m.34470 type:complete len:329 (+) Transcript_19015:201-1187(+)
MKHSAAAALLHLFGFHALLDNARSRRSSRCGCHCRCCLRACHQHGWRAWHGRWDEQAGCHWRWCSDINCSWCCGVRHRCCWHRGAGHPHLVGHRCSWCHRHEVHCTCVCHNRCRCDVLICRCWSCHILYCWCWCHIFHWRRSGHRRCINVDRCRCHILILHWHRSRCSGILHRRCCHDWCGGRKVLHCSCLCHNWCWADVLVCGCCHGCRGVCGCCCHVFHRCCHDRRGCHVLYCRGCCHVLYCRCCGIGWCCGRVLHCWCHSHWCGCRILVLHGGHRRGRLDHCRWHRHANWCCSDWCCSDWLGTSEGHPFLRKQCWQTEMQCDGKN